MPAIRYHQHAVSRVCDHQASDRLVEVRQKDGSFALLHWMGMICEPAAKILPGLGYAKIRAHEVTDDDGIACCRWYKLLEGQYVLGWRCYSSGYIGQGVYGIVDRNGCPIVIGNFGRKGAPKLQVIATG